MELGQAFAGFNPELRDMLRDAAIKADSDALALGELEAQKTNAASRMEEIGTTLKKAVDEGKLDAVRLPAFERGFRLRAGKELAQSLFQEKLTALLPDAMRVEGRLDPEKAIADTYAEVSKTIHPGDLYAREGFDSVAQGVMAGFRQRAAEGYTAEYRRAAETKMADEGSEILTQLATSSEADAPALRDSVKAHLDELRKELPVSQVNQFYVERVIAPSIQKLTSADKFTEARHLIDEMETLDVTGKGGLLGQTAVAKSAFATLRDQVERNARQSESLAYTKQTQARELTQWAGVDDAGAELNRLALENGGRVDPTKRFEIIDAYRKAHATEPARVDAFANAVHHQLDGEEKFRVNDKAVSELILNTDTLNKEQLTTQANLADALFASGEIPASVRTQIKEKVGKLSVLYGMIDEQDFTKMKLDLYHPKPEFTGGIPPVINFGDNSSQGPDSSQNLWKAIGETRQFTHEEQVTAYFRATLEAELRALGDPNQVPAQKATILDKATKQARVYARNLLVAMNQQRLEEEKTARGQLQAKRIRAASISAGFEVAPNFDYSTEKGGQAGKYEPGMKKRPFFMRAPPRAGSRPMPEADTVEVYFPAANLARWAFPGAEGTSRPVSLPELAKDIRENQDENAARVARDTYAYVKGRIGFTPEEIFAGVTKHGVPFSPSAVDPHHISVFRDRAELEKHWAKGEPDETFYRLGDALDPKDKMTPQQFYLAQLAIFSRGQ